MDKEKFVSSIQFSFTKKLISDDSDALSSASNSYLLLNLNVYYSYCVIHGDPFNL